MQTRNDNGSTKRWNESEAWSIVLIGVTGAGKSYFANALLGSTKPNRPNTKIRFDPDSPHASEMTCFYAQENVESVTSEGKFKRNHIISINDLERFSIKKNKKIYKRYISLLVALLSIF